MLDQFGVNGQRVANERFRAANRQQPAGGFQVSQVR